ncbi:pyridoxamine 5'-phosphate oxidase family protein [Halorubrum sp. JWXQ-INN 858]|nr:pyridoxamine 5'-phosphate oxidase family protein [Halorubrum sp. JWXQ-INN 858]
MDLSDYQYTVGMSEAEVAARLRETRVGVLSLATDDDAYAVPVSFFYDGPSIYFRLGDDGTPSRKVAAMASTAEATFVALDARDPDSSWSVVAKGPIRRLTDPAAHGFDEATVRERFGPFHVFDEVVEDVEISLYELSIETITGRRTAD